MWKSIVQRAGHRWQCGAHALHAGFLKLHKHTLIIRNYLLTYLLTPWCRVLLEKLTGLLLVKKFPAFHGTRRFITALTCVRHLSLFWASPIQSIYQHSTSWRSILILSTHLRLGLPSGLFPSGFPTKTLIIRNTYCFSTSAMVSRTRLNITTHVLCIPCTCYLNHLQVSEVQASHQEPHT